MVDDYIEGKTNILKLIENALQESRQAIKLYTGTPVKIKETQFSDCRCIYIPDVSTNTSFFEEAYLDILTQFLYYLREFQLFFLKNNIYLRGGISYGFHYENENFIFSEALIKAFELESNIAIYPRFIFDRKLAKLIKDYYTLYKDYFVKFGLHKMILVDWDGIIFINPFTYSRSLFKLRINGKHPLIGEFLHENDLYEKLKLVDLTMIKPIIEDVERNIKKYELSNPYISLKYKWLYELIQWNIDPSISKINFKYFLE